MFYTDTKTGNQSLVFIHGFCEDSSVWDFYVDQLKSEYRVICVDLPGFGKSEYNEPITSIDEVAERVITLLDSLHVDSFSYFGHSLGGYVGLALLENHPTRINKFSLVHSTAFEDPEERKEARDKTAVFLKDKGMDTFARSFIPPLFLASRREEFATQIEHCKTVAQNTNLTAAIDYTLAMKNRKERIQVLAEASCPTLLISGTEDLTVNLEATRAHQVECPNLQVELIHNTGHLGFIEEPEVTLSTIKDFLNL